MAHGDARKGKRRRNWRMEWVASTLTLPRNMVYPALLLLMRTPRLPAVDWTDDPADLNGLVRFAERRNLVSALVPSYFKWPLATFGGTWYVYVRREEKKAIFIIISVGIRSHKVVSPVEARLLCSTQDWTKPHHSLLPWRRSTNVFQNYTVPPPWRQKYS